MALIRRACRVDEKLSPYADTVRRNFQTWIMAHHSGSSEKFTKEQMDWLHMIRDHMIDSFHIDRDDLDMSPFDAHGGLARMYQLFGQQMDIMLTDLNKALAV